MSTALGVSCILSVIATAGVVSVGTQALLLQQQTQSAADLAAAYLSVRDWGNAKSFASYVTQALDSHQALRLRLAEEFSARNWAEDSQALRSAAEVGG